MTALANLARSHWRSHKPVEDIEENQISHRAEAPGHLACRDVADAIRHLPSDQVALMQLVLLGETSPRLLAERTGVPIGTVNSRLARAGTSARRDRP